MSRLHEWQIRQIWEEQIRPTVFIGAQPDREPVTVFAGGQPGVGKTRSIASLESLDESHRLISIEGDDYRQFHPDFDRIMRSDPLRMPKVTAHASGMWIQMCVDHANQNRYSIVVEGTWRHASTVLDQAKIAKRMHRKTWAVAIVEPPLISETRALMRFVMDSLAGKREARWTALDAQEKILGNLSDSVRAISISPLIDRFSVIEDGTIRFDGRPTRSDNMGWEAWHERYTRPLTADEQMEMGNRLEKTRTMIPLLHIPESGKTMLLRELDAIQNEYEKATSKKHLSKDDIRSLIDSHATQVRAQGNDSHVQEENREDRRGPQL